MLSFSGDGATMQGSGSRKGNISCILDRKFIDQRFVYGSKKDIYRA